jgi:hypothetical protein
MQTDGKMKPIDTFLQVLITNAPEEPTYKTLNLIQKNVQIDKLVTTEASKPADTVVMYLTYIQ